MASTPELKATSSVVPPMSFGELLDRMFNLYRHHLWLFVGIMAIPALVSMSMTFLLPSSQQPFTPDNSTTEPLAQPGPFGVT